MNDKELTQSLEDYLKAILKLERKNRVARVKDIAQILDVQMPSVTGALKNLRSKGLVNYEKNSFISLTEKGLEIAQDVEKKHELLMNFLTSILLLPQDKAEEEACEIEHVISFSTAERLERLTDYVRTEWLEPEKISSQDWKEFIE